MESKLKIISQSIQNNMIGSIIILTIMLIITIMLILIETINISMINLIIVVWGWLRQVEKCNHLLNEQLHLLTDKPHNLINEVNIHQNQIKEIMIGKIIRITQRETKEWIILDILEEIKYDNHLLIYFSIY
jgi:hypothetical protein